MRYSSFSNWLVDEIGRFVEDQQPRLGDDRPAQKRPLHLPSRYFADGSAGDFGNAGAFEQFQRPPAVFGGVARPESLVSLQARQNRLRNRYGESPVENVLLGQIPDQTLFAAEKFGSVVHRSAVGNVAQNRTYERCLPAAVGADDPQEIVLENIQRHLIQRRRPLVCDREVSHRDQYVTHCRR